MPKLYKHNKTGVLVWASTGMKGARWAPVASCWLDELPRPFKDGGEEWQWNEDSIMIKGRRKGPALQEGEACSRT